MGGFQITYSVLTPPSGAPGLMAVKVFSEPSRTLLSALLRDDAPVALLRSIRSEKPKHLKAGTLAGTEIHAGIAPPPQGDKRVRIVLVGWSGGKAVEETLCDAAVPDLRDFELTSERMEDGSFRHTGRCGGKDLAPLACTSPVWSLCCPGVPGCERPRCGP